MSYKVLTDQINKMLNKNTIPETTSITTTFTRFEVQNPIKRVKPSETNSPSSSQTSSNNSDNLLTGIVIGSLLSHSSNNNHDSYSGSHDTNDSYNTDFSSSDCCSCD